MYNLKPSNKLKFTNFNIYRSDLQPIRGSKVHGGSAVLVHCRIVHHHLNLKTIIQSTSIMIKLNNSEILVSTVYKRPKEILNSADLDVLSTTSTWSISAGDFNAKKPFMEQPHHKCSWQNIIQPRPKQQLCGYGPINSHLLSIQLLS